VKVSRSGRIHWLVSHCLFSVLLQVPVFLLSANAVRVVCEQLMSGFTGYWMGFDVQARPRQAIGGLRMSAVVSEAVILRFDIDGVYVTR